MAEGLYPPWVAPVFRRRLSQPDTRTCGPTCLVVAHAIADGEYADRVSEPDTFRSEILDLHRRVTSVRDSRGRVQLPWPRFFGTPPWGAAHQMTAVTGTSYHSRLAWSGRERAFDAIVLATAAGHRVPVFVGSTRVPRHVVLALGELDGAMRFYEPAHGQLVDVSRADFVAAKVRLAGWDRPWFVVLPA
jgi:hypothetical protein